MAAHTTITLDTIAPAGVDCSIDGGAAYTTDVDVVLGITTTDPDTTGYQMKIWGDVDEADNPDIRQDEVDSAWISYSATQAVKLSTGDNVKTINVKIRDDVWNTSTADSDQITLDTTVPIVTVAVSASPSKISKITGKEISTFEWNVNVQFEEYKVKVVPATNSTHTAGAQVPTTAGSENVIGSAGAYPPSTNIVTDIDGTDLESASAGDGSKIVKVFVKDAAGNWSV